MLRISKPPVTALSGFFYTMVSLYNISRIYIFNHNPINIFHLWIAFKDKVSEAIKIREIPTDNRR